MVTFSVKNQVRFKGNLVRQIRKDEKRYYEDLVEYSRRSLMLFPYHLSDVIVKGLVKEQAFRGIYRTISIFPSRF